MDYMPENWLRRLHSCVQRVLQSPGTNPVLQYDVVWFCKNSTHRLAASTGFVIQSLEKRCIEQIREHVCEGLFMPHEHTKECISSCLGQYCALTYVCRNSFELNTDGDPVHVHSIVRPFWSQHLNAKHFGNRRISEHVTSGVSLLVQIAARISSFKKKRVQRKHIAPADLHNALRLNDFYFFRLARSIKQGHLVGYTLTLDKVQRCFVLLNDSQIHH